MTFDLDPERIAAEYEQQEFNDWLFKGISAGWVSTAGCSTHNPLPLRAWEEQAFENGEDPCITVMRVWKDGYEHVGS